MLQHIAEGLANVDRALVIAAQTGEALWVAELHRVRGDLLLAQTPPDVPAAEAAFQQARHIAQGQAAKAWELRAVISLSRLWQQQGRRAAAYAVLAAIHSWFTEGADNPDLRDAAALLLIALR